MCSSLSCSVSAFFGGVTGRPGGRRAPLGGEPLSRPSLGRREGACRCMCASNSDCERRSPHSASTPACAMRLWYDSSKRRRAAASAFALAAASAFIAAVLASAFLPGATEMEPRRACCASFEDPRRGWLSAGLKEVLREAPGSCEARRDPCGCVSCGGAGGGGHGVGACGRRCVEGRVGRGGNGAGRASPTTFTSVSTVCGDGEAAARGGAGAREAGAAARSSARGAGRAP